MARNEQILASAKVELAEQGILQYTGRTIEVEMPDDSVLTFPEVEPIHTYKIWKEMGYQVRKGETAVAKIKIWMYDNRRKKKDADDDEENEGRFYKKNASFFKYSQVDKIVEKIA